MIFIGDFPEPDPLRVAIQAAKLADETTGVDALHAEADPGVAARRRITKRATPLVEQLRVRAQSLGGLDALMHEYALSSQEGVMLMCLAEALLRVPDPETADKLIADKIGDAHWERHLGHSESLFVNASTWALMLIGRVIRVEEEGGGDPNTFLRRLVAKSGEPVICQAMTQAMRIMGRQFVMGRSIEEALDRAREAERRGYRHSYDMLGESAHTSHTLAAVLELAGYRRDFEFQRLHGMGAALYDQVIGRGGAGFGIPCRIYAPVGRHEDLLAYLVRRLLENGSNTSFVNRIVDEQVPIADIVADPVDKVARLKTKPHPRIPLSVDLFGGERRNSRGIDLSDPASLRPLARAMETASGPWRAAPWIAGKETSGGAERTVLDPADRRRVIGSVREAEPEAVKAALAAATAAAPGWESSPAGDRAACLDRAVDPLEGVCPELMALCVREAGKTIPDDLAEVREAVDFCRYYTTGYGLTLGIHSRVDDFAQRIHARLRVGNTYVNRNMIGAAVGVQPFGGEGLSGTGPKAGDPRYLHRFATERTLTVNTAAAGGNAALLSLEEDDT
jgi:hypothetical protein